MPRYRYARVDGRDEVVDVLTLSHDKGDGERTYRCVGCEEFLIAKIKGEKVIKHFAHRANIACNEETYLHRLGKAVFFNEFVRRRAEGLPYFVEFTRKSYCSRFEGILGKRCALGKKTRRFDLIGRFDRIEMERRDGEFIPDLMLSSSHISTHKVYIEIAVTHMMTEAKRRSGNHVIEIKLESEEDLDEIRSGVLGEHNAKLVGFSRAEEVLVESACRCRTREVFFLLLLQGGESHFEHGDLAEFEYARRSRAGELVYADVHLIDGFAPFDANARRRLHRSMLSKASREGFDVRDCLSCAYARPNFELDPLRPIRCRAHDFTCTHKRAVSCELYTPFGGSS